MCRLLEHLRPGSDQLWPRDPPFPMASGKEAAKDMAIAIVHAKLIVLDLLI